MIALGDQRHWWKHWEQYLELERTYLMVTRNIEEQRYEHEWKIKFVGRGSRDYVIVIFVLHW